MDVGAWMKTVESTSDPTVLVSLFKAFSDTITKEKQVDYFDLKPLLATFSNSQAKVLDEGQATLIDALSVLIQFAEHDIEMYLRECLIWVVTSYLDYKVVINKAAKKCLQTYLVKTRNIDEVMRILVNHGLQAKNVDPCYLVCCKIQISLQLP